MTAPPLYLATSLPALGARMELAMELGLGLQIDAICHVEGLDEVTTPLAVQLRAARLPWPVTVRGPIFHLSAGGRPNLDLAVALQTAFGALAFAAGIGADSVTFHSGCSSAWTWAGRLEDEDWLDGLTAFWIELLRLARRCGIHPIIANLVEPDPSLLRHLADLLPATPPGVALDVGHWNLTGPARPLDVWIDVLGRNLEEIHLSDNDGGRDEHRALGSASVDFGALWPRLRAPSPRPPRLVLDVPTRDVRESLSWLRRHLV